MIAEGTVDKYVANTLGNLEPRSRARLAVWVVEHGLLAAHPA